MTGIKIGIQIENESLRLPLQYLILPLQYHSPLQYPNFIALQLCQLQKNYTIVSENFRRKQAFMSMPQTKVIIKKKIPCPVSKSVS